jgi:hypothetical protein
MTSTQYERIEAEDIDPSDYAETLIGRTIRDPYDREWVVTETDTKDGEATVCGKLYWCYAGDATVIDKAAEQ